MKQVVLAIIVLMFAIALPATTEARVAGATGLINIPNAEVVNEGFLDISYNHVNQAGYLGLTLGVLPGIEAGVLSRPGSSAALSGNVKVKLVDESGSVPAVAVGLSVNEHAASYYGVISKQVGMPGLRGHLGIGTGTYSGGFLGVSMVLNPVSVSSRDKGFSLPLTTLLAEFDGNNFNAGLSMRITPELHGQVFVSDFSTLGLGVRYRIDF